jgi:hypothetical protein
VYLSSKILTSAGVEAGVGVVLAIRSVDPGVCGPGAGAACASNEGSGCAGVGESDCLNAGSCGSCFGAPAFCASDTLETTKTPKMVTINILIFIVQSPFCYRLKAFCKIHKYL